MTALSGSQIKPPALPEVADFIENFKSTGSIIFYPVVLMVDDIYIHQITGANIRGVRFFRRSKFYSPRLEKNS